MAWELAPNPGVLEGAVSGSGLTLVLDVAAWAIGPSPDLVEGTVSGASLNELESIPVTSIAGEGGFDFSGTGSLDELAAVGVQLTGEGGFDFTGTASLAEEAPAGPDVVEITGEGQVGFASSGSAIGVVELTGEDGFDFAGSASVTAFDSAAPVVEVAGEGGFDFTGAGLLVEAEPPAPVVEITGSGGFDFVGEAVLAEIAAGIAEAIGAGGFDFAGAALLEEFDPTIPAPIIRGPLRLLVAGAPVRTADRLVDFAIKQGDTWPPIEMQVVDRIGAPVSLAGATNRTILGQPDGSPPRIDRAARVVDVAAGRLRFDAWQAGDTDELGVLQLEVELTYADGRRVTAPSAGYNRVQVVDDLG